MVTCERSRSLLRYTETLAEALPNEFGGPGGERHHFWEETAGAAAPVSTRASQAGWGDESRCWTCPPGRRGTEPAVSGQASSVGSGVTLDWPRLGRAHSAESTHQMCRTCPFVEESE